MADGAAGQGLPSSNRGVSGFRNPDAIEVGIDWVAASVDLLAVLEEQAWPFSIKTTLDTLNEVGSNAVAIAENVLAFYFGGSGFAIAEEARPGTFYKWRVRINNAAGEHAGLIELGGSNCIRNDMTVTARIELTGEGCRVYGGAGSGHAKRWLELRAKLESTAGRLTRIDVCADDLVGKFPVRLAQQWWESGQFDRRGQKPKGQLVDDFGSGDGKTLTIGSRKSEQFMRVYEKGRQLGDVSSDWVRYEAEFKASTRKELSLDILRDPAGYLLGAYPVLAFIQAVATRLEVTKEIAASTWKSARRHCKRQYGALLNFVLRHVPNEGALWTVIVSLASNKPPAWESREAAISWPEIVAVNINP